ncbi:MAG TPA: nuclear transport factor 2 family protein [Croceibacterium sp.]|nr:nuclear transport factor 2 family protein [Croceibacterium sp.]
MKTRFLLLAAAVAAIVPGAGQAQQRALSDPVVGHPDPESLFTSPDRTLNRNKQAALHIQRNLLKCHEWSRAGEWLTDKYIQHNPVAASGLAGVVHYFVDIAKQQPISPCPALSASDPNAVVAVVAEGDYVTILTRRAVPYADNPSESYTTTWFDTWRFVDGKADEHWDPATLPAAPAPAPAARGGGSASAAPVGSDEDRAAIGKLMWNYDRALDNYDAEAYAASFAPDGAFGQVKGRDALRTFVLGFKTQQDERRAKGESLGAMRHFTMNQFLEFTGPTTARYHYYHQTVFGSGAGGNDGAPRVAAAGNGVDDLVKIDGKWYIQMRNVSAGPDIVPL